MSQGMEATTDSRVWKEIEERMGVLQTALKKAEALISENEDHLEESRIWEEEAHQGDQGKSDSSEGQDEDVMVEGLEESGPTGAESAGPPRSQEAEPCMEVDVDDLPLSQLRRTKCSRVIPPQCLERWPGYRSHLLIAISPRTVKPHSRSCLPQGVSEALHMSPPHRLGRRRKKED